MLERLFIKNYNDVENNIVRNRYGIVAGFFGLFSNLFLGVIKLIIGIVSNSISIMVDAVNNITDSVSSFLTIVGFTLVNKKPTKHHPYGYARYEYICGFVVAIFMLFMGVMFAKESIFKIFRKEELVINIYTYIVLITGILVKYLQMKVYSSFSIKINSNALKTSAVDTRNDIISSFGILLSIIFMNLFNVNVDGFIGLLVSLITIYYSIKMTKEVLEPIIGLIPDEKRVCEIKEKLLSYEFVIGIHDLVIHNYGVNKDFVTVHVEIDSKMDMLTAHDLIDNIENEFKEENIDLTIHMDPVVIGNEKVDKLKNKVTKLIKKLDSELDIHDFRIIDLKTHTNIIFDCVIPHHKHYTKEKIIKYLKQNMNNEKNKYYFVIEIDRPFC